MSPAEKVIDLSGKTPVKVSLVALLSVGTILFGVNQMISGTDTAVKLLDQKLDSVISIHSGIPQKVSDIELKSSSNSDKIDRNTTDIRDIRATINRSWDGPFKESP